MIKDNFYIKVDNNDKYNPSGSFKSLAKLYSSVTVDGIMPTFLSDTRIWNPVIKSLNPSEDENPIAYDIVEQEDSSKTGCVNNKYEIDFSPVSDFKYGFVDTIVSNKLFKKSGENYINCPVISCYDAAIIKCHTYGTTWTAYSGRHLPNTSNFFPSAIIRGVAGGGGSGGANNVGDDSAGGGGGAGGFFAIYYRIKNEGTNPVQAIEITIGSGGTAGGSGGSGDGGTGGTTQISFEFLNNTLFTIRAFGGEGGQTGNVDYTSGGNGGRVE